MPIATDQPAYVGRIDRHLAVAQRDRRRIEVLESGGGSSSSSSGTVALLKITGLHDDSPGGTPMFKGDIYGNGSAAAATQTGVTVAIPGLASGTTSPSFGSWNDVPHCCGVSTTRTWTGATETHTDDTVYEAIGLLLVI